MRKPIQSVVLSPSNRSAPNDILVGKSPGVETLPLHVVSGVTVEVPAQTNGVLLILANHGNLEIGSPASEVERFHFCTGLETSLERKHNMNETFK